MRGSFLCTLVELFFGVFFPAIIARGDGAAAESYICSVYLHFIFLFSFDEVFYNSVSLCVVIHSVEFSDCCYITSYTQMINKNVLFPVDTRRSMSCFHCIASLSFICVHMRDNSFGSFRQVVAATHWTRGS